MKLCAVQLASLKGDLPGNLQRHLVCIEQAAALGAELVVFPELSLTGYEPRLAEQLAMTADDVRLEVFQSLSDRHQILVAVGGPYRGNDGPEIGMFVFRSGQAPAVYTKQMLHPDELPYFKAGTTSLSVTIGQEILVPAICFESLQMESALRAKDAGATVYVASVAKNMIGMNRCWFMSKKAGSKDFALVLTDQNMPRMDGISLTKKLRENPKFKSTPILILTTESSDQMKQAGRSAGATGWLVKPFDPARLIEVNQKVIR